MEREYNPNLKDLPVESTRLYEKPLFKKQETWVDIWVASYKDEHRFHKENGITRHKVWIIKETNEKETN